MLKGVAVCNFGRVVSRHFLQAAQWGNGSCLKIVMEAAQERLVDDSGSREEKGELFESFRVFRG